MRNRLDITRRLHEHLLEIVRTGLPLITGSLADADLVGLAHLREEMIGAVNVYCRHVHGLREAAPSGGDEQLTAEALVAGCVALHASYDSFRARWAHRVAQDHWYEYRLSAIVMMKQVRDHVRRAEALRTATLKLAA